MFGKIKSEIFKLRNQKLLMRSQGAFLHICHVLQKAFVHKMQNVTLYTKYLTDNMTFINLCEFYCIPSNKPSANLNK